MLCDISLCYDIVIIKLVIYNGFCVQMLSEPVAADPNTLEDQLSRAKTLNNEFVAQGRLIDNAKIVSFTIFLFLSSGIICLNLWYIHDIDLNQELLIVFKVIVSV